jgi:arsenite-transporting ATPase
VRTTEGAVLHLSLPNVSRAEVDLSRNGDELVVTVGSYRRLLTLPAGLSRYRVVGAGIEQGELQVRFTETVQDQVSPKQENA